MKKPTLATMKKSTLNFIKGLVPTNLYRAIEILFNPCCDMEVLLTIECGEATNEYILTIQSSIPIGAEVFIIGLPGIPPFLTLNFDKCSNKRVITYFAEDEPIPPGTYQKGGLLLALTPSTAACAASGQIVGQDLLSIITPGAYQIAMLDEVVVPDCS